MIEPVTKPPNRPLVLAVTGTNGKTSVATATRQLMSDIGWRVAGYDSTGITDVDGVLHMARVRKSRSYLPEMIEFQARRGAYAMSVEAFVGMLGAGLYADVEVDTAVCTGLESDHLDVHGSLEQYWEAKLALFRTHLRPDGVAVMAVDCAQGDRVAAAVADRGARLVRVGAGGDVRLIDVRPDGQRLRGRLVIDGDVIPVNLPFTHKVAVTNALLGAVAVIGVGGPVAAVTDALSRLKAPPGRLERVGAVGGVTVMVDTAHNPGALRAALTTVKEQTEGRLILVFGAGGERDRSKRPEMGRLAAEVADLAVLTDDNPRREPPARIRAEVRAGCPDCLEIPSRRDAIAAAILMARAGDVVLVTGRGDETHQLTATGPVPFDDREVIRTLLAAGGS